MKTSQAFAMSLVVVVTSAVLVMALGQRLGCRDSQELGRELAQRRLPAAGMAGKGAAAPAPAPLPADVAEPARPAPIAAMPLIAPLLAPPAYLKAWDALRRKALRTHEEAERYRGAATQEAAVAQSLQLLSADLLKDVRPEAQAQREFALEHLRAAMAEAEGDRREALTTALSEFVLGCGLRVQGLTRQQRGYARADAAAVLEILLSFAPKAAAALSDGGPADLQAVVRVAHELQATRHAL